MASALCGKGLDRKSLQSWREGRSMLCDLLCAYACCLLDAFFFAWDGWGGT